MYFGVILRQSKQVKLSVVTTILQSWARYFVLKYRFIE